MAEYITPEYYEKEYQGADAGDELKRYIKRASDAVDQVTGYALAGKDFDNLPDFIREQVMKATAAQVEYYVVLGGSEEVTAGTHDVGQVRIGSFSYSGSSRGGSSSQAGVGRISPTAIGYLELTGLLYRGIGVVDSAY